MRKEFVLCGILTAGACIAAESGSTAQSSSPAPTPRSSFEAIGNAASKVWLDSISRSAELGRRLLPIFERLSEINQKAPAGSNKPLKEVLSPGDLEEFNLLTAQMRYLQNSQYAEVLKRRRISEIISIAEIQGVMDEVNQELIANGTWNDAHAVNDETTNRLKSKLGLYATVWGKAFDAIMEAQQIKTALKIPFRGLTERLQTATTPSGDSDDLEMFMSDAYPDTEPCKFFFVRLNYEASKGDVEAKKVLAFLKTEWRRANR